ncbi:MAG: tetratricopeptide repeat protein [Bacteroidales bacterium]|nr:tetratricopeptide repeat protein [Bacteroidales bacterium]
MYRLMQVCFSSILFLFIFSCNQQQSVNITHKDTTGIFEISEKIRENPFNASLFAQRAALFWQYNKPDSAINDLVIAIKLDSLNEKYHIQLSDYYIKISKSDQAIKVLENYLLRRPQSPTVLTKIAKYYSYLKDYKKAKEYLDKAFLLDPQYAEAHFVKGMILYETKQLKQARDAFLSVIQYNPDESEAYMMLGLIHLEWKDSLAIQYFQTAARLKEKDPWPYYNMGYFYQETGQYAKAFDVYNYILRKIDRRYADAYFNQGYINMVYLKNYERAMTYYDSVLMLQPERVEAICNKAYCYEMLNDLISARSLYIKAKAIVPNYEIAIEGLNRIDKKLK